MQRLIFTGKFLPFLFLVAVFIIATDSIAQKLPTFREHEVIDAGNGMKVEVLTCRGTGDEEECDVIYYTDKRYLGKRKWEKASILKEMKFAARRLQNNQGKPQVNPTNPAISTIKKPEAAKPAPLPKKLADTTAKKDVGQQKTAPSLPKKDSTATAKIIINQPTAIIKDSLVIKPQIQQKEIVKPSVNSLSKPQQYSLTGMYSLARERSLQIKQAENNIDNFELDKKLAKGQYLPSASYNLGHYFTRGKNIDPVTNTFSYEDFSGGYTALALQLDIFSGFSRLNTIKQTTYSIKAAEYAKKRLELELLSNLTLSYAKLLLNKEQVLVQNSLIQNTNREIEVIQEKIKVGRLSKFEFYTFNARLNTQQANLVNYQNDSLTAVNELKELLNLPQSNVLEIAPIDTTALAEIYNTEISSAEFVSNILKQHPAIRQAEMETEVARLGEKISKSSYYPTLSLGGNVSSNYNANQINVNGSKVPLSTQLNDNLGQNLNINLRIPIFSQTENANRVKKERINIANAEFAHQSATNVITSNTLRLINDFNAAKQKYTATKSAWEQNKLSYELYTERYRVGQISSVELLAAQDNLNAATSNYLQTRLQMFFQYQLLQLLKSYN